MTIPEMHKNLAEKLQDIDNVKEILKGMEKEAWDYKVLIAKLERELKSEVPL